jgi:hypothetical protein
MVRDRFTCDPRTLLEAISIMNGRFAKEEGFFFEHSFASSNCDLVFTRAYNFLNLFDDKSQHKQSVLAA